MIYKQLFKWKAIVPRRADRLVKGKSMGKVVNQANGTSLWIDRVMLAARFH